MFDDDTCCGPVGEHPALDGLMDPASRWDETYNSGLQARVVEGPVRTGRVGPAESADHGGALAGADQAGPTLAPGCATITPRHPMAVLSGGGSGRHPVPACGSGGGAVRAQSATATEGELRQAIDRLLFLNQHLQRRNAELVREVEVLRKETRYAADMARAAQQRADDYLAERDDALRQLDEADDDAVTILAHLSIASPGVAE